MVHKRLRLTALLIASTIIFNSCIGSFGLTNNVLDWNKKIGDKWVNELVFFAAWIIPVYEISIFADVVVLNTIEFWTGSNPVAHVDKIIEGENSTYSVKSSETGYVITDVITGDVTILNYNNCSNTWSATINGNTIEFLSFIDENHVKLYGLDSIIELSESGVVAFKRQLQNMNPDLAIKF